MNEWVSDDSNTLKFAEDKTPEFSEWYKNKNVHERRSVIRLWDAISKADPSLTVAVLGGKVMGSRLRKVSVFMPVLVRA